MTNYVIFSHLRKRLKCFFLFNIFFLIVFSTALLITSCSTSGNGTYKLQKDSSIPGNLILTLQPDTVRLLRNPLTGWVLYGTTNESDPKTGFWNRYDNLEVPGLSYPVKASDYAHTLYIRVAWSLLNPQEDVYGWDTNPNLIQLIDEARNRNMRLAFRVVVDSRDKGSDFTPQFVRDAGAQGYETKSGKRTVWSPYPDDPVFQQKYEKFIQAFAERFNDSDIVDFIDGYGLGKWGEAHSVRYRDASNREAVFKWVIDLYSRYFTRVPLAINYHRLVATEKDWDSPDPDSEALLEYAFNKGYILRHDAFGMTGYYQEWEEELAEKWLYKRPIIMEGGWVTKQHTISLDPRKYQSVAEVREGEFYDSMKARVNMMDFRINETESWFEDCFPLVKRFIAEGGYRLYPDRLSLPAELRTGLEINIVHRWNNIGWGYCPTNIPQWNQKYKVAFGLLDNAGNPVEVFVDKQTDLSKWIKDNPVEYSFSPDITSVKPGNYTWGVAIVDTSGDNKKGLEIAVEEDLISSGWVKLFEVNVK